MRETAVAAAAAPRDDVGHPPGANPLLRWAPLAAVALALLLSYAFGLHDYLSIGALRRYQANLGEFVQDRAILAAALYVVVYIGAVGLSFPGASILTAAGGLMFGAFLGTLLALVAATIGATLIFLIARTSFGEFLVQRAGPRGEKLRAGFQKSAFNYLLSLRLVPLFPFWLVNLAAALFGMRLPPYVVATAIGILPGTFVLSYFGQGLGTALDGDGPHLSAGLFIALALLGALALVPVIVRWRRDRKTESGSPV